MGLNGSGKSTLVHTLAKKINFYEMDIEDYYFPEQKISRQSAQENHYGVACEHLGKIPFTVPRSKKQVQEQLYADMKNHSQFIISGVTMNWNEPILSLIDIAFIIDTPTDERLRRVQMREEKRFGSRVKLGGDMYEQQIAFRDVIKNREEKDVEDSAKRLHCKIVRLDGTKKIEDNIEIILRVINVIDR